MMLRMGALFLLGLFVHYCGIFIWFSAEWRHGVWSIKFYLFPTFF